MTYRVAEFPSQSQLAAIGMRVEVVWDDVTAEFTLPKFQPVDGQV